MKIVQMNQSIWYERYKPQLNPNELYKRVLNKIREYTPKTIIGNYMCTIINDDGMIYINY